MITLRLLPQTESVSSERKHFSLLKLADRYLLRKTSKSFWREHWMTWGHCGVWLEESQATQSLLAQRENQRSCWDYIFFIFHPLIIRNHLESTNYQAESVWGSICLAVWLRNPSSWNTWPDWGLENTLWKMRLCSFYSRSSPWSSRAQIPPSVPWSLALLQLSWSLSLDNSYWATDGL